MLNLAERVALKLLANRELRGIASVEHLAVDGDSLRVAVRLPDEDVPEITVTLHGVTREGFRFSFRSAECSRPWIATALNRFLAGEVIGLRD